MLCSISFDESPDFHDARNSASKPGPGFSKDHPLRNERKSNNALNILHSVPPSQLKRSHGIFTVCPSVTVFTITLGPTNPWLIIIAKETLVFRRAGISPALRLLVPTFLLPDAPPWVTPSASMQTGTLSYHIQYSEILYILIFGTTLSPDYLRRNIS